MAIRDHLTRVSKLRGHVTTVDPARGIIELVTAAGPVLLTGFDTDTVVRWPKQDEDWSIYEENGYWVLGKRFLNNEEQKVIQALQPGEVYLDGDNLTVPGAINAESMNVSG